MTKTKQKYRRELLSLHYGLSPDDLARAHDDGMWSLLAGESLKWVLEAVDGLERENLVDTDDWFDCVQAAAGNTRSYVMSWRPNKGATLRSWVRTQARRDAIREARKDPHWLHVEYVDSPYVPEGDEAIFTPRAEGLLEDNRVLEDAADVQAQAKIRDALRGLPQGDRAVLLDIYDGVPRERVAQSRGLEPSQVDAIVADATLRIKKALDSSIV